MVKYKKLEELKVKIFADGADFENIKLFADQTLIKGFTTNPSLMRKSGVSDYKKFALEISKMVSPKPISFEVFADDLSEMEKQALEIATWAKNINVKIPITNTKGVSTVDLIRELSNRGIVCNVTAILELDHLEKVVNVLNKDTGAILSVFAGRVADTGIDPCSLMKESVKISKQKPQSKVLWASTREILNIFQAEETGCHIITVPHDIIKKFKGIGKNLKDLSLETVKTFYSDAQSAGYKINLNEK